MKVSIIIPVYNAERFIQDGLESLKKQTLYDIEVIMVNDGSTDSSRSICAQYANDDQRFILIDQINGGSAAARRTGMLAAHGEYLGFIDSDDWAEPDMYEKLYSAAKKYDADIVFCNCYRDYGDNIIKCKPQMRNGYYDREQIKNEILSRSLADLNSKGENHVIRWANYLRIYRRDLIEKYQVYNDPRFRRCQDLQLTFEATLHAQSYFYMGDEYLYHNRVVKDSQSRGYTKDQWQKIRILIERLYQDICDFSEMDLKEQMDLSTFFFAIYSCENEDRKCEGINKSKRFENLSLICHDPLIKGSLESIPYQRLSYVNKAYYDALKEQSVPMIRKANRIRKSVSIQKSIIHKFLEIPFLESLYRHIKKAVK